MLCFCAYNQSNHQAESTGDQIDDWSCHFVISLNNASKSHWSIKKYLKIFGAGAPAIKQ